MGPIQDHTVLTLDTKTGLIVDQWGANLFYLPHGLTIDRHDNLWITDVAMHQAFKVKSINFPEKATKLLPIAFTNFATLNSILNSETNGSICNKHFGKTPRLEFETASKPKRKYITLAASHKTIGHSISDCAVKLLLQEQKFKDGE